MGGPFDTHSAPQWFTSQAAIDVLAERRRQIEVEDWTAEHDGQEHNAGELASAAAAYADNAILCNEVYIQDDKSWYPTEPPIEWPWEDEAWKPTDQRSMLIKAGALILAEIERLDREARQNGGASA